MDYYDDCSHVGLSIPFLCIFLRVPVGQSRYGPVDFSGVLYVKESDSSDYAGVVFGYQSNRKFYVAMWRRENSNFKDLNDNAGIKGVQLKVSRSRGILSISR